jgi:hypothetical protein
MSAHPTWVSRFGQAPTIALSMPAWNALGTAGYANVGLTGRNFMSSADTSDQQAVQVSPRSW